MSGRKRVCIVGAGASGLPSIRHALLYGFDVVCYEAQNDIGGLWRYKAEETDASSVMKSTVINTSKELTAYSDFPPPADEANFMHNTHMHSYLLSYASHFGLQKYITMNTKVLNVERAPDYAKSGRWNVTTENSSGETSTELFDGVLMCNGHHAIPYSPDKWEGQESFSGNVIHAHSYKDHKGKERFSYFRYEDKVVVVVGVGNSGGDVAVELSRIAKQVYLVSRRGTWVYNRIHNYGRPLDCAVNTRIFRSFMAHLPLSIKESMLTGNLNRRFDHAAYGLAPKHSVFSAHPTVNDELPNRIACGTIRVKPAIKRFTEAGLQFVNGSSVPDVDTVIVCTGYSIAFPAVEHGRLITVQDNKVDMYQYMFPSQLEHDTLAVIGLIQPSGSIMPISEQQARVFFDVLSGGTKLPSNKERRENAAIKREMMAKRYVESRRHTIQVDYVAYMDELAQLIGCEPPKWYNVLPSDPQLAIHLLAAPIASYFYRLRGPHAWSGAREAILSIEDRVAKATSPASRGTIYSRTNPGFRMVVNFSLLIAAVFALLFYLIF